MNSVNLSQSGKTTSETEMTAQAWPRTKTEALRDLDYLLRLSTVHQRLFNRFDKHSRLIELAGGSGAVVAALGQTPWLLTLMGSVVAMVAYCNVAFEFGDKARAHRDTGRRLAQVRSTAGTLTVEQIDAERAVIEHPPYIEGLRVPCYNEIMRSNGLEQHVRHLTCWQRLMDAIA